MNIAEQDKELLLKDLCTRLPYDVKVFCEYVDDLDNKTYGYSLTLNTWCINEFVYNKAVVKPYLRLMSSMTDEEQQEIKSIDLFGTDIEYNTKGVIETYGRITIEELNAFFNWLLFHHFDIHGLIKKGLALEAPEGMYDI